MNQPKSLLLFLLFISTQAFAGDREAASQAFAQGDFKTAMEISQRLAAAGDGDALGNIGNMHAFGQGVPQDEEKALTYWRKAAEKHVPSAFGNIASCYMLGKCGVPKDSIEAAKWYVLGAEHRHAISMITLSGLYDTGIGIKKDKAAALAWAALAVSNSPSAKVKDMASLQFNQAKRDATQDDLARAQELAASLLPKVNANVALYKNGS